MLPNKEENVIHWMTTWRISTNAFFLINQNFYTVKYYGTLSTDYINKKQVSLISNIFSGMLYVMIC